MKARVTMWRPPRVHRAKAFLLTGAVALAAPSCSSRTLHVPAKSEPDGSAERGPAEVDASKSVADAAQGPTDVFPATSGKDAASPEDQGIGDACGITTYQSTVAWPEVLVVLDRSVSMAYSMAEDVPCVAGAAACTTRWDAVKAALLDTVQQNPHVRWGVELFPSPAAESCGVSAMPQIPMTAAPEAAIETLMNTTALGGGRPTAAAIDAAVAYLGPLADQEAKTILLFTDGEPGCGASQESLDSDLQDAAAAAGDARAAGIPVFVLGLGPNASVLEPIAGASGTGPSASATSIEQIEQALGLLWGDREGGTRSCVFQTAKPPPFADLVYVYVDDRLVAKDANDGWTFGATTSSIVLTGSYCDRVLAEDSVEVQILFGCDPPSVLAPPP